VKGKLLEKNQNFSRLFKAVTKSGLFSRTKREKPQSGMSLFNALDGVSSYAI
jgi:hypothetical protein